MKLGKAVVTGCVVGALMFGQGVHAQIGYTNDCLGWAQMLHKEGLVHDSIHMHLLGCDDDRYGVANMHYHATFDYNHNDYCTKRARQYARAGWFQMPWTIAAKVGNDLPWCNVNEDGSYDAGVW